MVYFELELGTGKLTTHPQFSEDSNSWTMPIWYLKESVNKEIGEDFTLDFSYGERGNNSEIRFI